MGKLRKRSDRGNSEMESMLRERNPATTKPVENVQASWGGWSINRGRFWFIKLRSRSIFDENWDCDRTKYVSILNKSLAKETLELPPQPDEDGQSGRKVAWLSFFSPCFWWGQSVFWKCRCISKIQCRGFSILIFSKGETMSVFPWWWCFREEPACATEAKEKTIQTRSKVWKNLILSRFFIKFHNKPKSQVSSIDDKLFKHFWV